MGSILSRYLFISTVVQSFFESAKILRPAGCINAEHFTRFNTAELFIAALLALYFTKDLYDPFANISAYYFYMKVG